jgi:YVTN family beta-propeller protein
VAFWDRAREGKFVPSALAFVVVLSSLLVLPPSGPIRSSVLPGASFESTAQVLAVSGNSPGAIPGCTNCVTSSLPVGRLPETPTVDTAMGYLYVANSFDNTVSVIDGASDTVLKTLPAGAFPETPTYDPANGNMYIPDLNGTSVTVVDGASVSVIATLSVGVHPYVGAYDAGNGFLYFPDFSSSSVTVITGATNSVVATIPVGVGPTGATYDPANGDIYVPNVYSDTVSVLNGTSNTVAATVAVGQHPYTPLYDPVNGDLYVPCYVSNNVTVISGTTNRVVANIDVKRQPTTPAFDAMDEDIYVPSNGDPYVTVLSGKTSQVLAQIPSGSTSYTPTYDPQNGNVYVPNYRATNVSVILGITRFAVIPVGNTPTTPTFDPRNGNIYVANWYSNNVSVIPGGGFVPLSVQAIASPPSGPAWLKVNFTALPFGGTGFYTRWAWSFGNGGTSALQNPNVTYSRPGTYEARVNVTDNTSATNQSNPLRITVTNITIKSVQVTPTQATVGEGSTSVAFEATVVCTYLCPTTHFGYLWWLDRPALGTLASPLSSSTTFRAGNIVGLLFLTVNVTMNGTTVSSAPISISIVPASTVPWWLNPLGLGLPGFLALVAGAVAGVFVAYLCYRRWRQSHRRTKDLMKEI